MTDNDQPTPDATADAELNARVAAADPTVGQPDPDLARLRARVLAGSPDTSADVVPLRRRRPAVLAGAAAAGVALLAGATVAGVAIGRGTAPEPTTVASAPEATTNAESLPVVGAPSPGTAGSEVGPGTAEVSSAMPVDLRMGFPTSGFLAGSGLPDDAGTATGYRVVADDVDARALAEQVAAAFGLVGEPVRDGESWRVGDYDTSMVWVGIDALASWSFSDPARDPWACAAVLDSEAGTSPDSADEPAVVEPCESPEPAIGEREARREAERILTSLGVADTTVEGIGLDWETATDGVSTTVTAWQTVEGSRTQLTWSFTFGADGVAWASGFAAGLEPVPGYPIVGARTAVERSADPRWAAFGPSPLDGVVFPMAETAAEDRATGQPTSSGSTSIQVWWDPITVTGAESTLAQYWQPDGTLMILPAYRLATADERGTWAVIAVAESAVTFTTP